MNPIQKKLQLLGQYNDIQDRDQAAQNQNMSSLLGNAASIYGLQSQQQILPEHLANMQADTALKGSQMQHESEMLPYQEASAKSMSNYYGAHANYMNQIAPSLADARESKSLEDDVTAVSRTYAPNDLRFSAAMSDVYARHGHPLPSTASATPPAAYGTGAAAPNPNFDQPVQGQTAGPPSDTLGQFGDWLGTGLGNLKIHAGNVAKVPANLVRHLQGKAPYQMTPDLTTEDEFQRMTGRRAAAPNPNLAFNPYSNLPSNIASNR